MNILFGILALVLLAFLGLQGYVYFRTRAARGKPVTGLTGAAAQAAASGRKMALYFWSPSCASCKVQSPVIDRLRKDFPDVYSMNIAEDIAPARALGILGTPATVITEGGIIRSVLLGVKTEAELRKALS